MTNKALVEKLKNLTIMYGELYYQGRIADELTKPMKQIKELPTIPPEENKTTKVVVWGIFLVLVIATIYQMFFVGTFWCVATGILGIMVMAIAVGNNEEEEKQERKRKNTIAEYKRIQEENAQSEREYPLQRRVYDEIILEYRKAQKKCEEKIKEVCDALQLPQKYRNYASVCSLYQYLYTGEDATFEQACNHLDIEMLNGNYICNSTQAMKQLNQVKTRQPVWIKGITEQNQEVKDGLKKIQDMTVFAIHKWLYKLSGNELNYEVVELVSRIKNEGFMSGGKSVSSTMYYVENAYREILGRGWGY